MLIKKVNFLLSAMHGKHYVFKMLALNKLLGLYYVVCVCVCVGVLGVWVCLSRVCLYNEYV